MQREVNVPRVLSTDEIIKAVDCCSKSVYNCHNCPVSENGKCTGLLKYIPQLVNSLQTKIDTMQEYIKNLEFSESWYKDELKNSDKKILTKAYTRIFDTLNEQASVQKVNILGGKHVVKVVTLHDINSLKNDLMFELENNRL